MSYSITLIVFVHVDHQLSLVISILGRLALDNNGIYRRLSIADEVRDEYSVGSSCSGPG